MNVAGTTPTIIGHSSREWQESAKVIPDMKLGMLDYITTHPDGRTWAGVSSNSLALIHLEGGNNS